MKTTQITPHAFQLTRLGFVNCYLLRESDGFTLIDTGLSGSGKDILAAAQSHGAPIRRILLTHAHVDHVGSVDELAKALPGLQLAASQRSLPLLQKPPNKGLEPGEPNTEIKGGLPGIGTPVSHLIAHGELFGSLRCIETPGHIPGHFAFLDERDGTLYAGDALVAVGKLTVSGYAPWYFPLTDMATWNKPTAVASGRKLLDYPIERFACGHGALRSGGLPALRAAIDQAH
ncbi:MAG: MBL fold metallo-hydrolase [Acidobacteriota bacterium]|nr:MBL fold metallo-hydrolase [Acidobacteriota bacterium]